MAADLISQLPDHVIHHILSFLPTIYAIRMSLLSRRWRQMWYSIPSLKFNDYHIKEELFINFVEQCLKHRLMGIRGNTTSVITTFELDITRCRVESSQVDRWLSFVAQPHLKELHVEMGTFYSRSRPRYCLPQVALNLISLTILNLGYLDLQDCSQVNLPCLKSMSLTFVYVEAEVLHNLILGCPSLEELLIVEDRFFSSNLQISSSNLKFLHVEGDWERIQVDARNLESLVYRGRTSCDFDFASCKKLTHLSVNGGYFICDGRFQNFISGFPLLESLTLRGYDLVDIRHQYLKVLVLVKLRDSSEVKSEVKPQISIDAPNLVSFDYMGNDALLQIVMNSPNLLEANITFDSYKNGQSMEWYVNLLNFLSCLDCFKSMSFNLYSEQGLIFPENLRKLIRSSPLPNLKHLKVKTWFKLQKESELEQALRWLSPSLETLSME
ncbi:hypothetical protein TIFTF001_044355 [Ficus carica]|uniref:F-box domain-containing protein n=1 Tax=Ficus carica TaxID=3494 RepID=A0AA88CPD2_FICCA|nr:hypothetical protein TIFTF001_044349 [Ficus carica]GMN29463.1 hypothetical protein TIFTF001_044350 [Ficus carica]GMN29486.1 hypothetical protein TIFTF001_044352 [Ficus carica]GMN29510.1 hypothetical protein TIFTF001_044355 [Ficus carica]